MARHMKYPEKTKCRDNTESQYKLNYQVDLLPIIFIIYVIACVPISCKTKIL